MKPPEHTLQSSYTAVPPGIPAQSASGVTQVVETSHPLHAPHSSGPQSSSEVQYPATTAVAGVNGLKSVSHP